MDLNSTSDAPISGTDCVPMSETPVHPEWKPISMNRASGVMMERYVCHGCSERCRTSRPISEQAPKGCILGKPER